MMKFKLLALANGDTFENGILSSDLSGYKILNEYLPDSIALVILGKQKIAINTDFIVSIEM